VAYCGLQLYCAKCGLSRHQWDVPLSSLPIVAYFQLKTRTFQLSDQRSLWQVGNIAEILYGPFIVVAKLIILLQFARIFCPMQTGVTYWCIHFLTWTNLVFFLIDTFVVAFACTPRTKIYHPEVPGHCINSSVNFIITGVWNSFSDFAMLFLPLPSIWRLQIDKKKKWGLSAIFATGLL